MNSYVSLASPQRCCILSAKSQKHTMLVLKVRSVFMPRSALLCFALRSTCVALLWCSDSIILELGSQWVLTLGLHPQKLQTFSRLEWNCFGICDLHKTNNNLTINNLANPVNLVPLLWIYLLLGFMTKFALGVLPTEIISASALHKTNESPCSCRLFEDDHWRLGMYWPAVKSSFLLCVVCCVGSFWWRRLDEERCWAQMRDLPGNKLIARAKWNRADPGTVAGVLWTSTDWTAFWDKFFQNYLKGTLLWVLNKPDWTGNMDLNLCYEHTL